MKTAIATNNAHKLSEIKQILGNSLELYTLNQLGISVEIEETGLTFMENALIKARAICALSGLPALADDTGLEVDFLHGEPGVYSARYSGEAHNDKANRQKLLQCMYSCPTAKRTAHFTTVIALVYPDGKEITAVGKVYGKILYEERGDGGFGYDSLFYSDDLQKTFAEASPEEKNSVSHRGRALSALLQQI